MKLIADALDLQHRLPRIWRLVEALEVEPYKARHVAQATHRLSEGRRRLRRRGSSPTGCPRAAWRAIETAVAHAIAKYHPELLDEREKTGKTVLARHPAPPHPQ